MTVLCEYMCEHACVCVFAIYPETMMLVKLVNASGLDLEGVSGQCSFFTFMKSESQ